MSPIAPSVSGVSVSSSTNENSLLIRQNQACRLILGTGVDRVTTTVEALQDGRMGQLIRVQNLDSRQVYTGRVSGLATVQVDTTGTP